MLVLRPGGRAVHTYSADGTRLHAEVFGPDTAPTIVLAHGVTMQLRFWAYQVEELAAHYRVVVYDQRGHGRSGRPGRDGYSIEALGQDVHAILESCVPAGETAVLVGHSLGGVSIMSWAAQFPDEVEERAAACILVNTAASEIAAHLAMIGLPRRSLPVAKVLIRRQLISVVRNRARLPLRLLAFGAPPTAEHMAALMEHIREIPALTLNGFVVSLSDMNLVADLDALTVPTVVVGGLHDRLLPLVHSRLLAERLPALDQFVLFDSGHMGPWEEHAAISLLIAETAERYLPHTQRNQAYA